MRRLSSIVALIFIVVTACGGNGANINDPQYQPAALMLGDYDLLVGKAPLFRTHDFSTCPGLNPSDHSSSPTCSNHDAQVELSFDRPWVIAGVGPLRAWRPIDPAQGGIGDRGCGEFEFTLEPLSGDSELSRSVHPDVEANVWSGEAAQLAKFYSWGDTSEGIRMRQHGNGAAANCYHLLRARYALGVYYDQIIPSMRDGVVEVGRVSDFVPTSAMLYDLQQGTVEVKSGRKILAGFSSSSPQAQTSTTNVNAIVYACLDEDEDGTCDYERGETCWNVGGDYYEDKCCGFDADVALCAHDGNLDAYCANSSIGPRWVARDLPGLIIPGGECPESDVVSNGTNFLVCGGSDDVGPGSLQVMQDDIVSIDRGKVTHDFACASDGWWECSGDIAFSEVHARSEGQALSLNNESYFCAGSTWSRSLDHSESACTAAGFDWTGSKCCGEPNDAFVTFDDFGVDSQGLCINNSFVPNGQVVTNASTLSYFGAVIVCNPDAPQDFAVASSEFLPGIRPLEHGVCGTYLANATPGQQAVCFPDGSWKLKQASEFQFVKNISWPRQHGQSLQGCCATDECWTGAECIRQGEYYQVGEVGYRCE